MFEQKLLTTESERYFVNASDEIISWRDLSWPDLFNALKESERIWREWLFDGFLCPFSKHAKDPLSSFKKSIDDDNHDPTFLIGASYQNALKYRFVVRQGLYFDWFNANGLVPLNAHGKERVRFSKGFNADEALRSLSPFETESMWRSILLDEDTRVSTSCSNFESCLRYHADPVRELFQANMSDEAPLDFLNRIFNENIASERKQAREGTLSYKREMRLSIIRFIVFMANKGQISLPAKVLSENTNSLGRLYTGFIKRYAIRQLAGHRQPEIEAGMAHLSVDHGGQRQLRLSDILIFFCASNYGTSNEFAPELLALAQAATPGHFNNMPCCAAEIVRL